MPTNCKGQDKPGQSRGYQVAEDTDRGARGSPGRGGRGAGGGLRCCLRPAQHRLPDPACPQAGGTGQQPELGAPAAHRASASPGFTPGCVGMGVTSSSRMAATFGAGITVPMAKQGLVSAGGQLQKLPWRVNVALLPSLHGATPTSPRGNHSRAPLLPQATGPLCQHFVMVPKPSREDDPRGTGCHRASSCQHCRDAQILPASV